MSRDSKTDDRVASPKRTKKNKDVTQEKKSKKRKHDQIEGPPSDEASLKRQKPSENASQESQHPDETAPSSSPFYAQAASLYVPIPPIALQYASRGLCSELLSALILKYYPPLRGVVVAYSSFQISEDPDVPNEEGSALAQSVDEYAVSFIWVTAEFLVFRPRKGDRIAGWVSLQNEGHVGLICWNLFNARIARKHLSTSWVWIAPTARQLKWKAQLKSNGASNNANSQQSLTNSTQSRDGSLEYQGHYEDEDGTRISGTLDFTVDDVEASSSTDRERGYLVLEGKIVHSSQEPDERSPAANGTLVQERQRLAAGLQNGSIQAHKAHRKKKEKKSSGQ